MSNKRKIIKEVKSIANRQYRRQRKIGMNDYETKEQIRRIHYK